MRKVGGIDTTIRPASYSIAYTKGDITRVVDCCSEEGILAGFRTGSFIFSAFRYAVVRIKVEGMFRRIVASTFGGEGGAYAVCIFRSGSVLW